jgi:hypothetical protein
MHAVAKTQTSSTSMSRRSRVSRLPAQIRPRDNEIVCNIAAYRHLALRSLFAADDCSNERILFGACAWDAAAAIVFKKPEPAEPSFV